MAREDTQNRQEPSTPRRWEELRRRLRDATRRFAWWLCLGLAFWYIWRTAISITAPLSLEERQRLDMYRLTSYWHLIAYPPNTGMGRSSLSSGSANTTATPVAS